MIRALDHLDLVVTSLERSQPFYQELLGLTEASEIEGERGERVVYLSRPGEEPAGNFSLGLREKQSDAHGVPYDRYAVGVHHVAFELASRAEVDERGDGFALTVPRSRAGPPSTTTARATTPSSSTTPTGSSSSYCTSPLSRLSRRSWCRARARRGG